MYRLEKICSDSWEGDTSGEKCGYKGHIAQEFSAPIKETEK